MHNQGPPTLPFQNLVHYIRLFLKIYPLLHPCIYKRTYFVPLDMETRKCAFYATKAHGTNDTRQMVQ